MEDTQEGGKLIQEGSYGCAFTPPLPCKKSKVKKGEKTVGKVVKEKDAEMELKISAIVEGIPGYPRYFVIQQEDDCSAENFSRLRKDYESVCSMYSKSSNKDLLQLLSIYGGRSLEDIKLSNQFPFVRIFRHVLEGVALLHKQDICHCDIHEGNIIIDPKGTPRILDFGESFVGHAVNENTIRLHKYKFSPSFDYQAPELAVQNGLQAGLSMAQSIQAVLQHKFILQKANTILGLSLRQQQKNFVSFWNVDDITYRGDSWVPFYKTYYKAFDAWSVGVVFMKVLLKCLFIPLFVQTQWQESKIPITNVLRGLLQIDPIRRMSVEEALQILKTV